MKKILAIILAVMMLAAVSVTALAVEDTTEDPAVVTETEDGEDADTADDGTAEAPEPVVTPVPISVTAGPVTAVASPQKVYIDGELVEFEAYNINDYNYFKLRDIAMALNGSGKQFSIGYDEDEGIVTITCGEEYETVGGELEPGDGKDKTVSATASKILDDGEELSFDVYLINDYNFFKLRDLGTALDFYVGFDEELNAVIVDTTLDYNGDEITDEAPADDETPAPETPAE